MAVVMHNRKIKFDYHIIESFQAGLSLSGLMVKAIRSKKVNLNSSFVIYQNNRLEVIGLKYKDFSENVPVLLSKKEMKKVIGSIKEKGVSCVLLNIKVVGRWLKADIAIVKGKNKRDKRETIKKRDLDREQRRGEY